ncbi:hypothetical protein [Mycobacterium kyogaense]|uniref:hypothetical protein n=1 Tax=Mycobacterium kyogaense TaxID=2212479 RepID=UPI0013C3F7EF|nr:hypothetical protein [Mycobacterium kyogaense]
MNASLRSLRDSENRMLRDVLNRRDPALFEKVAKTDTVSRSDAELIVSILSDEFIDNLDASWEPTAYGTAISDLLQRINAVRLDET